MPFDIEKVRNALPGRRIEYHPTLPSTMTEAAKLAAANAPHGTIVLADEQTAGVGRLGRTWHSEAESGIYCSLLLRLELPIAQAPVATLLLGLATADAIQRTTLLACDLRWPNDVLIDAKKVAGILAQLNGDYVIAGIGINVNQAALPAGLRTPATSLYLASAGQMQSRESLAIQLANSIDEFCTMLRDGGAAAILRAFTSASSFVRDRSVVIEESGRRGVTAGLDEHGFLLVRYQSGQTERVTSGGVRADV
jgi:BirA family biotin operon repressor/biotin-[acetyl-CoA-carboxylase] ligase